MKAAILVSIVCALAILSAGEAAADDIVWNGGFGNWDDDASWSTGAEPTLDDMVEISDDDTVQVTVPGEVCAGLRLGTLEGGAGTLVVTVFSGLEVAGTARIGDGATGTVGQIGGTVTVGRMEIGAGDYSVATGILNLGSCTVGGGAVPSALNAGGTCTISGDLEIDTNGTFTVIGNVTVGVTAVPARPDGSVVSRGHLLLPGAPGTLSCASFTNESGGVLQASLSASGLNPIQVSGVATLDGSLQVIDVTGPDGRYDILAAGSLSGTFSDVTLPDGDYEWGIDGNTVYVVKGMVPVEETSWGTLKGRFAPER